MLPPDFSKLFSKHPSLSNLNKVQLFLNIDYGIRSFGKEWDKVYYKKSLYRSSIVYNKNSEC